MHLLPDKYQHYYNINSILESYVCLVTNSLRVYPSIMLCGMINMVMVRDSSEQQKVELLKTFQMDGFKQLVVEVFFIFLS